MRVRHTYIAFLVLPLILTLPAYGGVLFDRAFFDGKPNTFIDFEALPDGTVLSDLTAGSAVFLDSDAYITQGITAVGLTIWGEVQAVIDSRFRTAHALAGSGDFFLDTAGVSFTKPVSAFMLFAAASSWNGDASLRIFLEDGTDFDVSVEQYMLQITEPNIVTDTFRYGVVGFASDSALGITAISFSSGLSTSLDDVQFTMIPAPGTLAIALPMVMAGARRRRG